jgi:hypothetical protein
VTLWPESWVGGVTSQPMVINWDFVFKGIAASGAVLGAWALIRSYWLTRSKIALKQNTVRFYPSGDGWLKVTLFVSNLSSQGNSIVQWKAWLKTDDGHMKELDVRHGHQEDHETKQVDFEFNVTPFNLMPHATAPAIMAFFHVNKSDYADPFELKVHAKDMYGKKYNCTCVHPQTSHPH